MLISSVSEILNLFVMRLLTVLLLEQRTNYRAQTKKHPYISISERKSCVREKCSFSDNLIQRERIGGKKKGNTRLQILQALQQVLSQGERRALRPLKIQLCKGAKGDYTKCPMYSEKDRLRNVSRWIQNATERAYLNFLSQSYFLRLKTCSSR